MKFELQKVLAGSLASTGLAAQVGNSTGIQAANFNVSEAVAAQYGCTGDCYTAFSAGLAEDALLFGAQYNEDFYRTASNFSTSAPGDLLKFEPIDPTTLSDIPGGTTVYRFQYVSVDLRGSNVPVTGFIAMPYANRTNGNLYQTVAWAHGTSGVFKGCAPSAISNLYEYGSWAYLTSRGYAVIATDYAGLGNNYTGHPYLEFGGHANDMFYSIVAARKALGAYLTEDWISVGHSEGGGSVWQLSESPLVQNGSCAAGNYIGGVAQAPAVLTGTMAITAIMDALTSNSTSYDAGGVISELAWAAIGLRVTSPNDTFSFLADPFKKRLQLAEIAQACYSSMEALVGDLDIEDIVKLDSDAIQPLLQQLDDLSATGHDKSHRPLLVVQGLEDVSVLASVVTQAHDRSCAKGNDVRLQEYPGVGHDPVIPVSAPFFLQWMDNLFDGIPSEKGCVENTTFPFDADNMYMPDDN